eukprot:CAMPEP_0206138640 /NCGR_PEP_ID=MMETSP1473-20131121/3459_1 /ASSEMBLY_ACC=CAM_ASM_001109 /TAXON_ID=1461547 /ORGANISM="Stichococcus sp, Strain RCC1054" /LENGTH=204 /DNA_ID=CAMNT_0053532125 /DNA_START=631 /DNA_END=1246 /DNA_ORIENTATION=-
MPSPPPVGYSSSAPTLSAVAAQAAQAGGASARRTECELGHRRRQTLRQHVTQHPPAGRDATQRVLSDVQRPESRHTPQGPAEPCHLLPGRRKLHQIQLQTCNGGRQGVLSAQAASCQVLQLSQRVQGVTHVCWAAHPPGARDAHVQVQDHEARRHGRQLHLKAAAHATEAQVRQPRQSCPDIAGDVAVTRTCAVAFVMVRRAVM